jgi:hypothetical protein
MQNRKFIQVKDGIIVGVLESMRNWDDVEIPTDLLEVTDSIEDLLSIINKPYNIVFGNNSPNPTD